MNFVLFYIDGKFIDYQPCLFIGKFCIDATCSPWEIGGMQGVHRAKWAQGAD